MTIPIPSPGMASPHFAGIIGQTVPASDFPPDNYRMDDSLYAFEGNWAFCVFDSDDVPAARIGFGRGWYDLSDFGLPASAREPYVQLHAEVVTRDGAVLWLPAGRFGPADVVSSPTGMRVALVPGGRGREVFRIEGWPNMEWHFQSDDGHVEVLMNATLQTATILPDWLMPSNVFSMWMATGRAEAQIRVGEQRAAVSGAVFYDHPRVTVRRNEVAPFGWYLYAPVRFSDGTCLVSYCMRDASGNDVAYYSFGLLVRPDGTARWLPHSSVEAMGFDDDHQPCTWKQRWGGPDVSIHACCEVRDAAIVRAWGSSSAPQTRRENRIMPLVFDCDAEAVVDGQALALQGVGLAEYIEHV